MLAGAGFSLPPSPPSSRRNRHVRVCAREWPGETRREEGAAPPPCFFRRHTFHGDLSGSFFSRLARAPPASLDAMARERVRGGREGARAREAPAAAAILVASVFRCSFTLLTPPRLFSWLPPPPLPARDAPSLRRCIDGAATARARSTKRARHSPHRARIGRVCTPPPPPRARAHTHTHTRHGPVAVPPGVPVWRRQGGPHPGARPRQRGQDDDPLCVGWGEGKRGRHGAGRAPRRVWRRGEGGRERREVDEQPPR